MDVPARWFVELGVWPALAGLIASELVLPRQNGEQVPNTDLVIIAPRENPVAPWLDVHAVDWHITMVDPVDCARSHIFALFKIVFNFYDDF